MRDKNDFSSDRDGISLTFDAIRREKHLAEKSREALIVLAR